MATTKVPAQQGVDESAVVIEKARNMWERYQKPVTYIGTALIVIVGGWFAYRSFFAAPKEAKANEAIAKAQQYFLVDSLKGKALNGDGNSKGFIKIAKEYSGTPAGNLANYYAGMCYMSMGDYKNAEKYLKDFSSDDKFVQARAYSLLGDAASEQGKFSDAADHYKKAAAMNEKDDNFNSECLYRAAVLYANKLNKPAEAIKLYEQIRDNYPNSTRGYDVEKQLALLGETK